MRFYFLVLNHFKHLECTYRTYQKTKKKTCSEKMLFYAIFFDVFGFSFLALCHFKVFWSRVHEPCATRGPYTAHSKAPDRTPTATLLKSNHMPSRRPCLILIDLYVVVYVPIFDTRKIHEKSMKDLEKQMHTSDKCRKSLTKCNLPKGLHFVQVVHSFRWFVHWLLLVFHSLSLIFHWCSSFFSLLFIVFHCFARWLFIVFHWFCLL